MIRFIDLRNQDTGYRFAFWDTVTDQFITINGNQAWDTYQEFEEDCIFDNVTKNFKHLCPKWTQHHPS